MSSEIAKQGPPNQKLKEVIDLILQGHGLPEIHDHLSETGEDAAELIASAHEYFAAVAAKTSPSTIMGMVLEQTRDLYRQSVAVGDLNCARQCLKDMRDIATKMADYVFEVE